jgi:hypothetical protein
LILQSIMDKSTYSATGLEIPKFGSNYIALNIFESGCSPSIKNNQDIESNSLKRSERLNRKPIKIRVFHMEPNRM